MEKKAIDRAIKMKQEHKDYIKFRNLTKEVKINKQKQIIHQNESRYLNLKPRNLK